MISIFSNSGSNILALKLGSRANTQATAASASDTNENKNLMTPKGVKVSKESVDQEFKSLFAPNSLTNYNILSRLATKDGETPDGEIFTDFIRCYCENEQGNTSLGEYDIEGIIHTVGARYAALRYEIYNGDYKDPDALVANLRNQFHEGVNFLSERFSESASPLFTKLDNADEINKVSEAVRDIATRQKTNYVIFTNSDVGVAYLNNIADKGEIDLLNSDLDLTSAILRHEATLRAMNKLEGNVQGNGALKSGHTNSNHKVGAFITADGSAYQSGLAQGSTPLSQNALKALAQFKRNQGAGASGSFVSMTGQNKVNDVDHVYIHEIHLNDFANRSPQDPKAAYDKATAAFQQSLENSSAAQNNVNANQEAVNEANNNSQLDGVVIDEQVDNTAGLEQGLLMKSYDLLKSQEKTHTESPYTMTELKSLANLQSSLAMFINEDSNKSEAELGFQLGLTLVKGLESLKNGEANQGRLNEVFISNFDHVIDGTLDAIDKKLSQCSTFDNAGSAISAHDDAFAALNKDDISYVFNKTVNAYFASGSANDAIVNGFDAAKEKFVENTQQHENLARNQSGRKFFTTFYQNNKNSANMYGIGQSTYHKYTFALNR